MATQRLAAKQHISPGNPRLRRKGVQDKADTVGVVVDLAGYRQQRNGGQPQWHKTDPALWRAADAADDGLASLLAVCELLTAAGRETLARECLAATELVLELRGRLPGGLQPAA